MEHKYITKFVEKVLFFILPNRLIKFLTSKELIEQKDYIKSLEARLTKIRRQIYYSQEGEDLIIERLFKNSSAALYLDIGANHPTRFSNTYKLYQNGWRGFIVEPNKELINKYKTIRPNDTLFNFGVSNAPSQIAYFMYEEDALNTFSEEKKEHLESLGIFPTVTLQTQVLATNDLIHKISKEDRAKIDFLNIDVEGFDLKVLQALNWDLICPKVICVEECSLNLTELEKSPIFNLLTEKGYQLNSALFNSLIFTKINS